jgi:hypothetical protein
VADHTPVATRFNLSPQATPKVKRWQWRDVDWELFTKALAKDNWSPRHLVTISNVDEAVKQLVNGILRAAGWSIPRATLTRYSRPGYTAQLRDLRHRAVVACRRAAATRTDEDYKAYKALRNRLGRESGKAARQAHCTRVTEATESIEGFWNLAKWCHSRGVPRQTFTPTL